MGLLRAFLASEVPAPLQDAIEASTRLLRRSLGSNAVRWVPAHNIHLTLKFLGDISESNLALVKQLLITEVAQFPAFDVQIEGIGSFPNSRRPRVIWVGLTAPSTLAALQHSIDAFATRLGYGSEEHGFSPHLTIGRIRQNVSPPDLQRIRSVLEETKIGHLGTCRVKAVYLFKSELQAEGSIYTKLFSAPLISQ
jgi:RNA 2',3'-cyclic 3'-phosphodiesterase